MFYSQLKYVEMIFNLLSRSETAIQKLSQQNSKFFQYFKLLGNFISFILYYKS